MENGTGKMDGASLKSEILLWDMGAQFCWGPSERLCRTHLRLVALRETRVFMHDSLSHSWWVNSKYSSLVLPRGCSQAEKQEVVSIYESCLQVLLK